MNSSASPLAGWRATLGAIEESRWGVLIPMVVAGVLGIIGIGDKSFWLDEAFSASIIRLPTSDLLVYMFHNELQASPYYLSLQVWSTLGYDEAMLRLLSVVFGVLAVAATYAVARRYGVALPAALLLAVSPFFIHYEQEARVYSLLVAWCAITTLAYLRLVERPGRRRALIYMLVAAVLIYVHPLSGWILVAHAVVTLLFAPPRWRRRLLALYVPVLVASIPMIRFLILNHGRASWIPPATPGGVAHTLVALSGGAAVTIAFAIVVALALRRVLPQLRLPKLWLPVLWLVAPVGGILLMSVVIQPLWVDRYLIGILPPLVILVAYAVKTYRWRWAILTSLVALSLLGVNSWYVNGVKDNWRAAAAFVDAHAQPTDGVIMWPDYYRLPFGYYTAVGEPLFPSTPWSQLYMPFLGLPIDPPPDVHNERIWLVRSVAFAPSPEIATLLAQYDTVETHLYGRSQPEIDLLVRRASP